MEPREEAGGQNSFQMALDVLRRRKWLAILTFLATSAAVLTTVMYLPDVYRSSATVLIERQQIPSDLVRSTVTSALETRLQTISQEILSRSRLEELISRFGLYEELRQTSPIEVVLERMRRDVKLELRGTGNRGDSTTVAFNISFAGRDPQRVAAVTNTLASFYIEENLKARGEQAAGTSQFLRAQLENMKADLEEQELQVSGFKKRYVGELPHQQEANLTTLEQLNTRLRLNTDNQIAVSQRLSELERQLAEAEQPTEAPDATEARIAELREKLRELRQQYSDKYPDVIQVKNEIAALAEQLRTTEDDGLDKAGSETAIPEVLKLRDSVREANIELETLKAEADRLRSSIATYQGRVDGAPLREQQYQVLMRDYETTRQLYQSLLGRQKEAELAENMEQRQKGEQFRIIEPAFPSEEPAAPNRTKLAGLGLLLGLGLAAAVMIVAEQLDTSFHSPEALRATLPVPVLLSIPLIVTTKDKWRRRGRFAVSAIVAFMGLALIVGSSYYFATENDRLVSMLLR